MILLSQGDRVRIVEPENIKACEAYKGFETVVTKIFSLGVYVTDYDGDELFIKNEELKYLEKIEPKKTKNQRISALEKEVAELKKVVEVLSQPVKNMTIEVDVKKLTESIAKATPKHSNLPQSNNQKRAAIIEKAKLFVEARQAVRKGDEHNQDRVHGNSTAKHHWYETEFAIKNEKVTAVIYWLEFGKKRAKKPTHIGRAKCHPHDVFNEHIGKAIALGRALGLDVSEFEQAVQPDDVVVGMIVAGSYESKRACYSTNKRFTIKEKSHNHYYYQEKSDDWLTTSDIGRITNDTNAQYEEAKVHESNKAF
ncbi:hypothetical protein ACF3OH_12065 [Chryseomicrobium aureum]|uniref:hypothetical protein n=1 Tax=Chryseomicrobium aureum TaxID=1441723 RepID=UPI00370D8963